MSSNTPPVFEALPLEVLGNVLRQMASPEDLYSTIRASPKAFGSFLCFREAILIEVLQAHLPAEIFAEYLGLLHIPKHEDFNHVAEKEDFEYALLFCSEEWYASERCRYEAWLGFLNAFFKIHFENIREARSNGFQRYKVPQPADKCQINYIIAMYGTLKRVIRDYQPFVRMILMGNPPPLCDLGPSFRRQETQLGGDWAPLTKSEAIRLQRAFLRYELCSRLNGMPSWKVDMLDWDGNIWVEVHTRLYQHLSPWEEDEIVCAWTFVLRQYQLLLREVMADFRCDVRRLSRKAQLAADDEVILAPGIPEEFSSNFFHSWSRNMAVLGLPMLQQVLRSGFADQRRLLKNTSFERLPDSAVVSIIPDSRFLKYDVSERTMFGDLEVMDGATPIYESITFDLAHWSRRDYRARNRIEAVGNALKDTGWVFWEHPARLESLDWHGLVTDAGGVRAFLEQLKSSNTGDWFVVEKQCPEQSMFVTKEDLQYELSGKYAVSPAPPGAEQFFLDRLRDISDWSSKEVSPAFREICQGLPTSG